MSDAIVNGLAGAGGGIVAQFLTYPLQAVNTRQQTERKAKSVSRSETGPAAVDPVLSKLPRGTFEELLQVIKREGWGGLYRGLGPSVIGTAFSQGVYYYFYQIFRNEAEALALARKKRGFGDGSVGMFGSLLVAALAGCLNVVLTNPIWVIVTRLQTQTQAEDRHSSGVPNSLALLSSNSDETRTQGVSSDPPTSDAAKVHSQGAATLVMELYKEAGILGFWKGVLPTLIMVSNPSIQFMLYESLLKHLTAKRPATKNGLKRITAMEVFVLGALAKLGATVATYPLLVVKSRLQAKQDIGRDMSLQYTGTLDAIIKMVRYEGLVSFYKGMSTKIVQSVVAAAVLFMIKEELVKGAQALVPKSKIVSKE